MEIGYVLPAFIVAIHFNLLPMNWASVYGQFKNTRVEIENPI